MATVGNFFYSPFIHHRPSPPPPPLQLKPFSASLTSHAPNSHIQTINIPTPVSTTNIRLDVQHSDRLTSSPDRASPRWFSPLDAGSSRLPNSPILLYLPGIGGSGFGLSLHHQRLGEMFDIWCLHIPPADRTPFPELVKLVERTVKYENQQSPERPIYLVGQSFGACLALAVAARNPQIDLVLVLANPATSFNGSQLRPLLPLLESVSKEVDAGLSYILNLITGTNSTLAAEISKILAAMSSDSDLSGLNEVFSMETFVWKLKLLDSACSSTNSRLHAVKAQTLILSSGKDQLLPSKQEGERLHRLIPKSDIRTFDESGHTLFMDQDQDLVTILKCTRFYRRSRNGDYVYDYLPPTDYEFKKARDSHRFVEALFSPVMFSTLEDGKIVKGLSGIPSTGPVIIVGYHMMLGLELAPLVANIYAERGILVRGVAHPLMFNKLKKGRMHDLSNYDIHRLMGAVPVSPTNFFKLLKSKSHILLYPGGMREALHRKGEEYKLFWPERSEFVRMAARFGAKIVPFGVVGEDDIGELVFDYDDQMKIPYFRRSIQEITEEVTQLRSDFEGEVANQDVHLPVMSPKLPGRFYYLFGKPIDTQGIQEELRNRDKAHELYLEVKSEVENCLSYLKDKRQNDPYRSILSRLAYQLKHGLETEIPTFEP
ncbi:phytyl ester synthase 2, chloroplastic-like isoform X1 [Bidens hawaiensis]|uniref:phytyl ester synthase 2, chloroplastic-like isoform X1 n=1 Tax=Bidens hawaiensis TaxID=980011 RepID=UPI0040493E31